MANAGEYLQLPDNSYVQFPGGLDEAGKLDFAKKAYSAFDQQLGQGAIQQAQAVADNQAADLAYAQSHPGTSLMGARQARVNAILANQTTPGEQLRQDNNPVVQGLQAAGSKLTEPGVAGGIFNKLAAPGAGLGQAAGTTAHNILSNIPGLGGPAGVIPAAGAALAHGAGTILGDTATGKLVGGALGDLLAKAPQAFVDAINAVRSKGLTGAISDALPAITKEGKINQLAPQLGQPATFGERVANPVSGQAQALYKLAEAQGPVKTSDLADSMFEAYSHEQQMSSPNSVASKAIGELYNKFANNPQLAYADVLEEAQRLRRTAQGLAVRQPQASHALMDTYNTMLDTLDNASPLAKQAGKLWRQDMLATDIIKTMRGDNPGSKIRNMLEAEPSIAASFGWDTPAKIEGLAKAADKIGATQSRADLIKKLSIGTAGAGFVGYLLHRKAFDALFEQR